MKQQIVWVDIYGDYHYTHDPDEVVTKLTSDDVRRAIRVLYQSNTRVHSDGYFHAIVHPEVEYDLLCDPVIVNIYQYQIPIPSGSSNPLINGSVPIVYGCKFERTTLIPEIEFDDYAILSGSSLTNGKFVTIFRGVNNAK